MLKRNVIIGMLVLMNQLTLPASSNEVEYRIDGRYICATNIWALRNSSGRPIGRNLKKGECVKLVGITKDQAYLKVSLKNKRELLLKASSIDVNLYTMLPPYDSPPEDRVKLRTRMNIEICKVQSEHLGRSNDPQLCEGAIWQKSIGENWWSAHKLGKFTPEQSYHVRLLLDVRP
jgi:hypothetical protein